MRISRTPTGWLVLGAWLLLTQLSAAQWEGPVEFRTVLPCTDRGPTFFFHVPSLTCIECTPPQVPSADGLKCECPSAYRTIAFDGGIQCSACENPDHQASEDLQVCLGCGVEAQRPINIGNDSDPIIIFEKEEAPSVVEWVDSTDSCGCPAGYVLSDYNNTGQYSERHGKRCLLCPFNTYVDPTMPYQCTRCPDPLMSRDPNTGVCVCPDGYVEDSDFLAGSTPQDAPFLGLHVCLDAAGVNQISTPVATFGRQTYFNVIDADGSRTESVSVERSEPHMTFFLEAAVNCASKYRYEACQALANLCTLNLFDSGEPACSQLSSLINSEVTNNINGFAGWRADLPWMFYEDPARTVLSSRGIGREVSLSGDDSKVRMVLTVYAVNGTYLGMQELNTQLLLCKGDDRHMQRFMKFGTNAHEECRIDLLKVIREYDETVFYELWVIDAQATSDGTGDASPPLYPVPVIITNYREDGRTPNEVLDRKKSLELGVGDDGEQALESVVLHRRFFLWDNIAGKKVKDAATRAEEAQSENQSPDDIDLSVVRWARTVELRFSLQSDDGETSVDESIRIYPPQLVITYEQQVGTTVPRQDFGVGDDGEELRYPEVEFKSAYTRDLGDYWYTTMILFIVMVVLMIIAFGVKTSVRNQSSSLNVMGTAIDLFGVVADGFFIFLFFSTGYWFAFFKLQSEVKVLLPRQNPHPDFLVLLITSMVFKVLQVLLIIQRQCSVDIFFIDWEKEKQGDDDKEKSESESKEGEKLPNVSVWRSILIANEWCEMQSTRHTDVDFTLMFLLLFLAGLKYQNLANPQPNENDLSDGKPNVVIRFFVTCLWYFVVVAIQLLYKALAYRFDQDPLDLFVDLCQLSNISAFILDEPYHGYYIHGRSVHPNTDVNMQKMQTNLEAESNGTLPYRGLTQKRGEDLQGQSDQVFELYITQEIKDEYTQQFTKMLPAGGVAAAKAAGGSRNVLAISKAHHAINEFLKSSVVDKVNPADVQMPSFLHKMVDAPPDTRIPPTETPILVRDSRNMWSRVLFYGIEFDLALFDLLWFTIWDLIFQDVFISALLTYVLAHGLQEVRAKWGGSNVAKKTLVDEKFLI